MAEMNRTEVSLLVVDDDGCSVIIDIAIVRCREETDENGKVRDGTLIVEKKTIGHHFMSTNDREEMIIEEELFAHLIIELKRTVSRLIEFPRGSLPKVKLLVRIGPHQITQRSFSWNLLEAIQSIDIGQ